MLTLTLGNWFIKKAILVNDENQHKLIKYSKETATRLLSQSLRNQVYITLNKQVDETKVIPAMELKRVNQKVESLPSGTSIINVYDREEDIQGRLLILGNPGSGKSTALYKVAETLQFTVKNMRSGLINGLINGLKGGELEIKTQPNQGIRSSIYNAILTTGLVIILGGGLYLGLWMISGWLNQIDESLFESLKDFLILMVSLSLIISLSSQAVLQHFSLRLVLTMNNYTPWNYARFLDYCTEQLLLQRVGGGYRFIHRLLQEHLISEQ